MHRWNRLELIVLAPFLAFLILAATGLYVLIFASVEDFANRSINENLSSLASAAYEEADREIDRCDIRGVDCIRSGPQRTISQLSVFQRFEDFARGNAVGLIVSVRGDAVFVTGMERSDAESILRQADAVASGRLRLPSGVESYVRAVAFVPWGWRVVLVKDASAFEVLARRVRIIYVGSAAALLVITSVLLAWLRQALVRPIYRIAGDFGQGRTPDYKGVRELEFLSNNIGGMMKSLKDKSLQLQTTLESMSDGITVFDRDMRLVVWNERYTHLSRFPPGLLHQGLAYADVIRFNIDRGFYAPGDTEAQLTTFVERARKLDPPRYEIERSDGTTVEVRRAPMPDGGFVTTYTDATDRKQAARLEMANEAKSEFLANMSHDLRKPVAAIIEDVRLLLDLGRNGADETQRQNLENVLASSTHLLGMIDELLEMSRIEAGQVDVKADEVTIGTIVEKSLRVIEPVAKAKGLSVHAEVEPGLIAVTDSGLLSRILMNLAGNAAQYTTEGSVRVRARRCGDYLEISVIDTGVGIPSDKLGVIFEKFQQIEPLAWTMRPAMGLGLGLAISREFAHLLGGAITVESTPGKGSTFTVSIPIRATFERAHE